MFSFKSFYHGLTGVDELLYVFRVCVVGVRGWWMEVSGVHNFRYRKVCTTVLKGIPRSRDRKKVNRPGVLDVRKVTFLK